jgi:menaquinol-cytochrome c reductase iron-sulfur subunit
MNLKKALSRRDFLKRVVVGGAGIVTAAVATPLVGSFLTPWWQKSKKPAIAVAHTDQIPIGTPTFVRFEERAPDGWLVTTESLGVWILTKDGKNFTLYDPHCTHLRCPYYWNAQTKQFDCPCHGGIFDINGNVIGGPPPRPLDHWEFTIEGGEIITSGKVITAKELKQQGTNS